MEPTTNGSGAVEDRCSKCNSRDGQSRGVVSLADTGRPCKVTGCPGRLDSGGQCACCQKRAAWQLANSPKRVCEICAGSFLGRANAKFCPACRSVVAKVAAAAGPQKPALRVPA